MRLFRWIANTNKGRISVAVIIAIIWYAKRKYKPKKSKGGKGHVDKQFFKRVKHIIKIAIPGVMTPEFGLMLALLTSMVFRTMLSVHLATVQGKIVKAMIDRKFDKFV